MRWTMIGDAGESPGATRALAVSEAVKDGIIQSALDCIVTMDAAGKVVDFNPAAERTFGYPRDEAVGRQLADLLIPERFREAHKAGLRRNLETGQGEVLDRRLEMTGMRADGTEFPVELTITRIDAGASPIFAGFVRDLTDERQAQERMEHLATRDQLTGLPNRTLLRDHLVLAVARVEKSGGALALLKVDLDHFGMVNESFGRATGDAVLQLVAERLEALAQVELVARDTSDQFLLVAELSLHSTGGARAIGPATARAIAVTVADAVERPLEADGHHLQLGAHVGVSLLPGDATDADSLLDHAEVALRRAQRVRKAVDVFTDTEGADGGLSFLTDLRGALDRHEFELHYQPIVQLPSRDVVGAEALIRWRHPQRGLIEPDDFIPLLEESGLMEQVGRWVVAEAMGQVSRWQDVRGGFTLALNLSLAELAADGIVKYLVDVAERTGVPPASVTIEITETAAMSEPERMEAVLGELADAGFPLAIDDFGTGHSSLARLWRLPVSTLKIDRSFIAAMLTDAAAGAMVATIIRLAEGLGVRTVAEGIETEDQCRLVAEHGCTLGQGYLFGRPVPAGAIDAVLAG